MGKILTKFKKQKRSQTETPVITDGSVIMTGSQAPGTSALKAASQPSYLLRCVVIGNDGSGKSSLIDRFVSGKFKENAH